MLTPALHKLIEDYVTKAFGSLRMNLLGPESMPKSLVFSFKTYDPKTTLASNYLAANSLNSPSAESVDKETIQKVQKVAEYYIDSLEKKSLADITRIIGEKYDNLSLQAKREGIDIADVIRSKAGAEIMNTIETELFSQKEKMDKAVDVLVNHELHNAQNVGALDGIVGVSKAVGIADPVVFKLGVMDDHRCKYCWSLWTLPDKVTPKLYKLSELSGSPGQWRNPEPSVSPTHVNCRDILTVLMPGFGFDAGGRIVYVDQGHDEYAKQRG